MKDMGPEWLTDLENWYERKASFQVERSWKEPNRGHVLASLAQTQEKQNGVLSFVV
ncbi:hypothetical protein DY000_02042701 [Brassica cretica]|uniref:Uncharacterized protein n=1 Tax=Brassica cretica TaxID=69181 RepID=A0ABQ7BRY9_BRACR|nr:hypothetical protein DY000_02042701 [Brassica cretica]